MPVGTLPIEYVPIIGYSLTFVSSLVVGVVMGIMLQKRKETHELRLKEMDIQQRRDEMSYADLKEFRNRKALAGEDLIKEYTLFIQELEARKKFYQHQLEQGGDPETYSRKSTQYEAHMNKLNNRLAQSEGGLLGKYFVYFADAENENAGQQFQDGLEERDDTIRHRLDDILDSTHNMYQALLEGMVYTPEAHTGFRAIATDMANEKKALLNELIAIMDSRLETIRGLIFHIREDISGKKR
ncbi:hypothetical protein I2I05_08640 [Hymenobacter sp. BT683]|uniref:DUF4041 domain-containing protein n=1 Tax=Hymenobacter jeongseonensis TaxID=2791027 RepID=A0ABS0IGH5_9BACT|nr:hypothetical protein [Hymenobacter jeongseonensis]MBF9237464.1 hypothetical protein [Hymenobacter jeongseonensis]